MSFVTLEHRGPVGLITMNRPEALNALNDQVLRELDAVLDQVEADDSILVAVITGAGRSFVAGADIGQMSTLTAAEAKAFGVLGNRVFLKLENLTKPTIAAVNGFALGGGCELSMACDIRVASEKAKFGQPEVGLGITPGFGGTQRLPRLVGSANAMELILTARNINAQRALEIGLVSHVYPAEEMLDRALALADGIAANAQGLSGIEKVLLEANPALDLLGACALPVVLAVEAGMPPEELVERHRLAALAAWFADGGMEALVLGCTHFPYFKEALAARTGLPLVDPAEEMLRLLTQ